MKYLNEQDIAYIENLAMKVCQAIMEAYVTDFDVEKKRPKSLTLADKNPMRLLRKDYSFSDYAALAEESKDDFIRLQNDYYCRSSTVQRSLLKKRRIYRKHALPTVIKWYSEWLRFP